MLCSERAWGLVRLIVVTAVAAGVVTVPAIAREGPLAAGPLLVVRTYDQFGVPPGDMKTALRTIRTILSDAGITVVSRDCMELEHQATEACQKVLGPAELVIRILASGSQSVPSSLGSSHALGYSVVDVQQRAGSLATVYGDRLRAMATESQFDFGRLIGCSIAHEIGHLLLGTSYHSNHGLMRGSWSAPEIRLDRPWDWGLSRSEADEMRRALATRSRKPNEPVTIAAGGNRGWQQEAPYALNKWKRR
jgi:hypothetical protein